MALDMEKSIFSYAGRCGIYFSAATALGSLVRGTRVHDESLTMLVGGVYNGVIFGFLNQLLPETTENSSNCLKITKAVLQVGLGVAATLTAPQAGEDSLHYNVKWDETVTDCYTGAAIGAAAVIVVGAAIMGGITCVSGSPPSFFTKKKEAISTKPPEALDHAENEQLRSTIV